MASSSISIQVSSPSFSKSSKTAASSNVCFVSHRGKRIKSRSNRCSIRSVPQKDTLRFFHSKRLVCASAASVAYDAMPKDAPLPSLYPPEPKLNRVESEEPKLKVVIVGGGLAGLSTAVELLEVSCSPGELIKLIVTAYMIQVLCSESDHFSRGRIFFLSFRSRDGLSDCITQLVFSICFSLH